MRILITGANGFIGAHLVRALHAAGHDVVGCGRSAAPPDLATSGWIRADFSRDTEPEVWLARLANIDVVINAVGILRENRTQTFAHLHTATPQALFSACARAGVRHVIQISALGADAHARSAYHLSKKAADDYLRTLPLQWSIVQPSLVFGAGGASARLFTRLAVLPCIPLVGGGAQTVQPIHIDDVRAAIVNLVAAPRRETIALVGPEALTLREFLQQLRCAMGLQRARVIAIPLALAQPLARVSALHPRALLTPATLAMLLRGNSADAAATRALLGRAPRAAMAFIDDATATAQSAWLGFLLPLMRLALAAVWFYSAWVSLFVFPLSESYALLARIGLVEPAATMALYGAALLDLAFAWATLFYRRAWMWASQLGLIAAYSALIAVYLPEFWQHPFGPLIKNLPMAAGILLVWLLEARGLSRR